MTDKKMKYFKRFAVQKIKVQGVEIVIPILGDNSEIVIGSNLSEEMDRVSAQLAYWYSVLAEAREEQIKVDSWYRNFRGTMKDKMLRGDGKLTDWKLQAKIDSSPKFLKFKEAIATAEKNVQLLEGICKAYEKKGNLLQSKGANVRNEMQKQGMATKSKSKGWNLSGDNGDDKNFPDTESLEPDGRDPAERMSEIISKKKAKVTKKKLKKDKVKPKKTTKSKK